MDAARILGDLPVDVAKFSGQVFAAEVHAALTSRRRKRNEIALAIDGHGISIYGVCFQCLFWRSNQTDCPSSDPSIEAFDVLCCISTIKLYLSALLPLPPR